MNMEKELQGALLSEASYANLQNKFASEDVKTALITEGFSQTQAEDFIKQWRVVAHQPNTLSGFSATLFERRDSPGNYALAIRGTKGLVDIYSADYRNIVRMGYAREQIYSLYNYFSRLITPTTESVGQWVKTPFTEIIDGQIVSRYEYQADMVAGLGVIVDATGRATNFDARVEVAGHSLGGHLALAFSRLFPNWTDGVSLYNTPGIESSATVDAFFQSFGSGGGYPQNLAQMTSNIIADQGFEWIAGLYGLPAPEQKVFIEDQGVAGTKEPAGNHSIKPLTDALALYSLLASLDPSLTVDTITPLLEAAAYRPEESLENTLNALSGLFGIGGSVAVDDRDALYRRINAIQASDLFKQVTGGVTIKPTASLSSAAGADTTDGLAYRYALVNLNPFTVTEDGALCHEHNTGGDGSDRICGANDMPNQPLRLAA